MQTLVLSNVVEIFNQQLPPAAVPNVVVDDLTPPESVSASTLKSIVASAPDDVIADIAVVLKKLFYYLNEALERIGEDLDSRIQALNDVNAAQRALDNIKAYQPEPYDPSVFDVVLPVGEESPAHGMSLWKALVLYGFKKESDGRPTKEAELDALIGTVKTRAQDATSLTTKMNQRMTMLNRTRESYASLLSEIVMGNVKLMRAIIGFS